MNGNDVCRTCLSKENLFPMFNTIVHALSSRKTLDKVLMDCTSVQVDKLDGLPQKICPTCIEQINQWLLFKDNSIQKDKQLRSGLAFNEEINSWEQTTEEIRDKNVCRTCLSTDNLFPMFYTIVHTMGSKAKLTDALIVGTSVKVDIQDGLPQNMCATCIEIINQWLFFKDKSREIDKELRSELSSNQETNSWEQTTEDYIIDEEETNSWEHNTEDCIIDENFEDIPNKDVNTAQKILEKMISTTAKSIQQVVNNMDTKCIEISLAKTKTFNNDVTNVVSNSKLDKEINLKNISAGNKVVKKTKPRVRKKKSCDICGRHVFNMRLHKLSHLRTISRLPGGNHDLLITCPVCGIKEERSYYLSMHMQTHDNDFTCFHCKKRYKNLDALKKHVQHMHLENRPKYSCDVCGVKFKNPTSVKCHKVRLHNETPSYICPTCGKGHGAVVRCCRKLLKRNRPYAFQCEYCKKKFVDKTYLKTHIRIHTGEKPYSCTICSKSFNQNAHLTTHLKSHGIGSIYQCQVCGQTFLYRFNYLIHQRKHTGEKPFKCTICSEGFICLKHLETHMKSHIEKTVVTKEELICCYCNKQFKSQFFLKMHQRLHTGENLHECEICKKKFSFAARLKTHLKLHESPRFKEIQFKEKSRRQYICSFCDKSYMCKQKLVNHERTHTGEKPYQCTVCSKRFHAQGNLYAHKKIHMKTVKVEKLN